MKNPGRSQFKYLIALTVAAAVLGGCTEMKHDPLIKAQYLLDVTHGEQVSRQANDLVVEVSRFRISSNFSSKSLVYKISDVGYEADFYNEFLAFPSANITEESIEWLAESRIFRNVTDTAASADRDLLLEGNITALYGDFTASQEPKAVMAIRFALIDNEGNIEMNKSYSERSKLAAKDATSLIKGFNQCLAEILTSLEKDLKGYVSK
jgi:ABC-type uncharacterized transport system auxiliary subunit